MLLKSPYFSCLFVFRRLRFLKVIGLSEVGKIFFLFLIVSPSFFLSFRCIACRIVFFLANLMRVPGLREVMQGIYIKSIWNTHFSDKMGRLLYTFYRKQSRSYFSIKYRERYLQSSRGTLTLQGKITLYRQRNTRIKRKQTKARADTSDKELNNLIL